LLGRTELIQVDLIIENLVTTFEKFSTPRGVVTQILINNILNS
jgi:hypothetical protein